jgi:hypothetical protein
MMNQSVFFAVLAVVMPMGTCNGRTATILEKEMKSPENDSKRERDSHARKILKQLEGVSVKPIQLGDWPNPPWVDYPDFPMTSMAWRMGSLEDYRSAFADWFGSLSEEKMEKYVAEFPEPEPWKGYYELVLDRLK